MSEQEVMKKWQAFATPGEHHKALQYFAGKWKVDSKFWMQAGAPPQASKYVAVQELILGGRYLVATIKGTSMGMPFEGRSTMAYDNFKKEFVSTWIDNFGTGLLTATAKPGKNNKEMVMASDYTCPISGQPLTMRTVTKIIDDNKYTFEMYEKGGMTGPKERKTMEMVYVRQK
ncbi:MAG: DUF1579 domain-containing protein [bacterium]|nr:DUF1579 domain-containing protein [bacterium]